MKKKLSKKKVQIVNNRIEELLNNGINPFSYYINNKKNTIRWYFEVLEFIKYLNTISPGFKLLWCMADFVHMIEIVYMYQNTEKSPIYSYINTKNSVRSFRINHKDFYVEYTLYEADHFISIKVHRDWNDKAKSEISFPEGQAVMETRADEILMFNIIEWTMIPIRALFENYYKLAKEVKT